MGYRVDRRVVLVLEDMDGAEVEVTIGVPLSALKAWDETTDRAGEWSVFLGCAEPVWNLEDKDGAIPVDEAALERLPDFVTRRIMLGWRKAAVEPPAPLPPPSSDGEP